MRRAVIAGRFAPARRITERTVATANLSRTLDHHLELAPPARSVRIR